MIRYQVDDHTLDAGDLGSSVPVLVTGAVIPREFGYYDIEILEVIAFFKSGERDVTAELTPSAHISCEEAIEKKHEISTMILGEGA